MGEQQIPIKLPPPPRRGGVNSLLSTQCTLANRLSVKGGSSQLSLARVCPRAVPGKPWRSWEAGLGLAAPCTRRELPLQVKLHPRRPRGFPLVCVRGGQARVSAWPDLFNFGGIGRALAGLPGLPPCPCPVLLPRGSGREGGVSGAGGRDRYKSAGCAPAQASLAALRRDEERCGKHGRWRGRCARATQCVDYLQPLLVQYAGAPEHLNGVATPLPGLDHSAAFPYEEDTSE